MIRLRQCFDGRLPLFRIHTIERFNCPLDNRRGISHNDNLFFHKYLGANPFVLVLLDGVSF
jgi:hypothetical protein